MPLPPIPIPMGISAFDSIAVLGDRIYVFGGVTGPGPGPGVPLATLWIYDTITGAWVLGPPLPTGPLVGASVAVMGSQIYIAGGSPAGQLGPGSVVHMSYDPFTGIYTPLAPLPVPTFRAHAAAVPFEGDAGTVHHFGNGIVDDPQHLEYDVATDTWAFDPPVPDGGVTDPGVVSEPHLGIVGVMGATAGGMGAPLIRLFDPFTDTWLPSSPMLVGASQTCGALYFDGIDGFVSTVGGFAGPVAVPENQMFTYW